MDDEPIMLLLYVDDLFLIGNDKKISEWKDKLTAEFEMKGPWHDALFLVLKYGRAPMEFSCIKENMQ